jgi:hypothetical protein
MNSAASWAVLATGCLVALFFGLRFRRGHDRRSLRWYRNPSLPTAARNIPLVIHILAGLWIPLLLVDAPALLNLQLPVLPRRVEVLLMFGYASYFFLSVAVVDVLLYRPPIRLIPAWLREDDRRLGYTPPKTDRFDKIVLAFSLPFFLIGIGLFVAGLVISVTAPFSR